MYRNYKAFHEPPDPMQYACLECRKAFKQVVSPRQQREREFPCPQCGIAMWQMGRAFKAPPQRDRRQWRKVEAVVRGGLRFHHNGFGPWLAPKTPRGVAPLLDARRDRSEGERFLARVRKRSRP